MRITNDEEYFKILKRIVNGADYLENPLIKPEDYEKGMKLYDELCKAAREYRTAEQNGAGDKNDLRIPARET